MLKPPAKCRKALQLLDHVAQILPQRIPSKKLLPLVIKAAFEVSSEVREAALLLLSRLARDQDILDTLKSVSASGLLQILSRFV